MAFTKSRPRQRAGLSKKKAPHKVFHNNINNNEKKFSIFL